MSVSLVETKNFDIVGALPFEISSYILELAGNPHVTSRVSKSWSACSEFAFYRTYRSYKNNVLIKIFMESIQKQVIPNNDRLLQHQKAREIVQRTICSLFLIAKLTGQNPNIKDCSAKKLESIYHKAFKYLNALYAWGQRYHDYNFYKDSPEKIYSNLKEKCGNIQPIEVLTSPLVRGVLLVRAAVDAELDKVQLLLSSGPISDKEMGRSIVWAEKRAHFYMWPEEIEFYQNYERIPHKLTPEQEKTYRAMKKAFIYRDIANLLFFSSRLSEAVRGKALKYSIRNGEGILAERLLSQGPISSKDRERARKYALRDPFLYGDLAKALEFPSLIGRLASLNSPYLMALGGGAIILGVGILYATSRSNYFSSSQKL